MKTKKLIALGALAAMGTLAPQNYGADAEVKAKADLPKAEAQAELKKDKDLDVDLKTTEADRERKIKRYNKASGLLGMEVRNRQNEKLGEIKDLVLDPKNGKVSYTVLAVGGFLGIGEKLLAVPMNAFEMAEQDGYVMLDADRAKIEAAPGFAATNWPRLDDPNVASRSYWTKDLGATGAPARSEVEVKTDRDKKIYTEPGEEKKIKGKVDVDIDKD